LRLGDEFHLLDNGRGATCFLIASALHSRVPRD
jgi:hypothetical protein